MYSTAPVRGLSSWCLRVSLKSTSAHQCPASACGQKTTLWAPRWRSSRASAPHRKDQSDSAADWRSPKSGDHEDDGRPGYPKRSRRPRETSWVDNGVTLRPPPVWCSSREVVSAIGVMWLLRFYTVSSLRAVLVTGYSRCFRDFGIIGMPRESSTVFLLRR